MKIKIQYGGHQVMKTNNTYFLKNFEKKNPILIIKTFVKSLNNLNSLNLKNRIQR